MLRSIKKRMSRSSSAPVGENGFEDDPLEARPRSASSASSSLSANHNNRRMISPNAGSKKITQFAAAASHAFHSKSAVPAQPDLTKVEQLSKFDACIEAADALAAASGQESKLLPARVDESTGLADCSVLVSPDGDLLLMPQSTKNIFKQRSSKGDEKDDEEEQGKQSLFSELMLNGKDDYESSIFLGNDLEGDKSLNGFSAKGWSIPSTTAALQQTQETLQHLQTFVESIVLCRKTSAAEAVVACSSLRAHVPSLGGQAPRCSIVANDWEIIDQTAMSSRSSEAGGTRVGPLLHSESTLNTALVALETYVSNSAESESKTWRQVSSKGFLADLSKSAKQVSERALNRRQALDLTSQRARDMEQRLQVLQQVAQSKWDAVFEAEDQVTKRVEVLMAERSREREKQRLELLRVEEEKSGARNSNTSSEEIWNIVQDVADLMEDGSFEPMSASISGENDDKAPPPPEAPKEPSPRSIPIVSREQVEHELGLPELRALAMSADDSVADAADAMMNILSSLDTTRRSARVAAETCLVSAGNAQAACLRSFLATERAALEERMRQLNELETVVDRIDVRADLDTYISIDKQERGGSSHLGDDDDGGIASALAILSRHVDGSMGHDALHRLSAESTDSSEFGSVTTEEVEDALEKIFAPNDPHLSNSAPDTEATTKARKEFEDTIDMICKAVSEAGPAARSKRSMICYALNAKRSSQAEIASKIQFDALCRIFSAVLTGCNAEGGVSNAKMCIMLAQTFYLDLEAGDDQTDTSNREHRVYVKSHLKDHPLWSKDDFWDEALSQQISESLTHSGVMTNFEKSRASNNSKERKKSEWTQMRKTKWYDLNHMERIEAASQVQAVVFAQLGALAHSMLELGCGLHRSSAFVRRMSIRNQLPSSQRTMLLQHLMKRDDIDKHSDAASETRDRSLTEISE